MLNIDISAMAVTFSARNSITLCRRLPGAARAISIPLSADRFVEQHDARRRRRTASKVSWKWMVAANARKERVRGLVDLLMPR